MTLTRITRANLPPDYAFGRFQKREATRAIRIQGQFVVDMGDKGWAYCENGWLLLGPDGAPYPVEDEVFTQLYEGMK